MHLTKADPYYLQLRTLLETASLQYTDEAIRVELYQADPETFLLNTFEGPFLKDYEVFHCPDFMELLGVMEGVAPLAQWEVK